MTNLRIPADTVGGLAAHVLTRYREGSKQEAHRAKIASERTWLMIAIQLARMQADIARGGRHKLRATAPDAVTATINGKQ